VVQMLTEFGIGTAVVTRPELTDEDVAELNSVSVLLGATGAVVTCALAPLAGLIFHQSVVVGVVLVMSLTLVVSSFRSVPWALLQRELRFKRLAVYQAVQNVALAGLSVALAAAGFRYWTLVIAAVLSAFGSTAVTLLLHRVPFAAPDWRRLRGALTFSRDVVVTRLAWYAYTNVDFAVASRMLGATAAGYYGLAWTVAHLVVDKVAQVVYQVTPAALARVQGSPEMLRRYFLQITAAMTTAFWPLTIGLAVVARDFVPVVLGARWAPSLFPLTLLSAYSSVWIVLGLAGQVLLVVDEVAFGRRNNLQQLALLTVAFVIGAHWGVNGIALGWVLGHPVLAVARVRRVLVRLEISTLDFLRHALLPAAAGCAGMALAVCLARATVLAPLPPLWRLVASVLLGAATYLGIQATLFRARLVAALAAVRTIRRSRPSVPDLQLESAA
jgi:O-antigen/teichoic acid export membrane protein